MYKNIVELYDNARKVEIKQYTKDGRLHSVILNRRFSVLTEKGEMIADEDNLLLVGDKTLCISTKDIPMLGKTAVGNILMKGNVSKVVKL